jgi:hypothetical protein
VDAKPSTSPFAPDVQTQDFYVDALRTLDENHLSYVVGGGYAMARYTGIQRSTKDLDIFVKPSDEKLALQILSDRGYRTEYFYPFWIAKALQGEVFIDILYNSGNGLCPVDDEWFSNSNPVDVHGYHTRMVPPEEQIFSKAFVQDRDRFDGADVIHLLYACSASMDWSRLIRRFHTHERVLLAHILLFGYAYPTERSRIPHHVSKHLESAIDLEAPPPAKITRGPNLAQKGYGVPIREWGYMDGRLKPHGPLTPEEVAQLPEA